MTLTAITMTAPEAASPVQMYRATYSPDDNKLRLYAASRLDQETYKKVHDAGFRWAPKQALFVAPAWTPGREDVLLSLAGEIEDEDSTLAGVVSGKLKPICASLKRPSHSRRNI